MGTLFVVSTPIGNLEDISLRAIKTLFSVDFIACEDTRRTGLLLNLLKQKFSWVIEPLYLTDPKLVRCDGQAEQNTAPELLELIKRGKNVALVSDAGTPLVSDPGYILVNNARSLGIPVISVPGPAAFLAALTVSGLPMDHFFFLGYPPEKPVARSNFFQNLLSTKATYVFYCAPHKLKETLEDMRRVFGDIEIVVCRELTKIHEEVWRGSISMASNRFTKPKGEFVLLFNTPQV